MVSVLSEIWLVISVAVSVSVLGEISLVSNVDCIR